MDQLEQFITKDNKKLRCGYTTGSCAAAAAKAAAVMLLSRYPVSHITLMTPKGIRLNLSVQEVSIHSDWVSCAVRKHSGDDPDITHGVLVYAKVTKIPEPTILIDGGIGVGRITKPGLDQPVGAAAINRVPRQMIIQELEELRDDSEYPGGFHVEISIPEGVALAAKTFNPRLGIVGGISVLGTSGIVEPMSDQALLASIRVELNMLAASGVEYVLLTPGNYGETFARQHLHLDLKQAVKCSNFIGETLDLVCEIGFRGALLIGHVGKLVKLAGGMMNTHSRYGDCRMEILAAHTGLSPQSTPWLVGQVLQSNTTEEALEHLEAASIRAQVMESIAKAIHQQLDRRVQGAIPVGAILFSNQHGLLGQTVEAVPLTTYFHTI